MDTAEIQFPSPGAYYLCFFRYFNCFECLQIFHNAFIISEAAYYSWYANKVGLGPPFHEFEPGNQEQNKVRNDVECEQYRRHSLPPQAVFVSVCVDAPTCLKFKVALWGLLFGTLYHTSYKMPSLKQTK